MQIKKVVYKNRIRLKEFFVDFDKVCLATLWQRQGTCTLEGPPLFRKPGFSAHKNARGLQLRTGFIFENQFLSGLSMAGLDKQLTAAQLQA